jgi:transcriptional regulator with XRE-family HTH domain
MLLGIKLRQLRKRNGLSVRELSERSGVAPAPIYDFEASRRVPSLTTIKRLSAALGITFGDLEDVLLPVDGRCRP